MKKSDSAGHSATMGDPAAARAQRAQRRSRIKELEDEIKLANTELAAIQAREALRLAKERVRPPVRSTKKEERELDLKLAVWIVAAVVVWQIVIQAVYGH